MVSCVDTTDVHPAERLVEFPLPALAEGTRKALALCRAATRPET